MAARRVLVIEDEAGARNGLRNLLAEDGYVVRTAPSGESGIECASAFQPDTVVCDFTLPGIDGLQVLRRLRQNAGPIFFIVLTAACGDAEAERALRREADLFLRKPLDLRAFREALAAADTRAPGRASAATPSRERMSP